MSKNEARNNFFEVRKMMLKEQEKLNKIADGMTAGTAIQILAIQLYGLFYALEILKINKSAWTYKKLRETLPFFLRSDDKIPKELRDFIINELTREKPFYPGKGKHSSEVIMQRALEIGSAIEETKAFNSSQSIYDEIIPKIAEERNMTEAAVKKDYEQKYLPIFKAASENAMQSVRWYKAGLDEDERFRKWLLENP